MAIINCPECTKEISDYARNCPQCGFTRAGSSAQRVAVTDVNMGFMSMVTFMVKWAFAAIPAIIIILLVVGTIAALVAGTILRHPG